MLKNIGPYSIVLLAIILGLLRMTVTGRDVFTWDMTYESFAHIYVGAMIGVALATKDTDVRWTSIWCLVGLTFWEGAWFLIQGHRIIN